MRVSSIEAEREKQVPSGGQGAVWRRLESLSGAGLGETAERTPSRAGRHREGSGMDRDPQTRWVASGLGNKMGERGGTTGERRKRQNKVAAGTICSCIAGRG